MFNQTIYNGLINIVPFWSSNIIQFYGLGNEYNMAFNLILTEILKIGTINLNEIIWFMILTGVFIFLTLHKMNFTYNINMWNKNIIKICGKELYNDNTIKLQYCKRIKLLNKYLLSELRMKNITYVNDIDIIINPINNYKLKSNIYLNIERDITNNIVTYTLWSYNESLDDFIDILSKKYNGDNNYELVLIGNELNNNTDYPLPIPAINSYVSLNYNFPKFKCLKIEDIIETENKDDNDKTDKINNSYIYSLDNIENFELDENIFLTIYRDNNSVYYCLKSNKICCKEWVENKIKFYNQNKAKYKNKLVLKCFELTNFCNTKNNPGRSLYYSKQIWAINSFVINELKYQNFSYVEDDISSNKYILEPIDYLELEEDIVLSLTKIRRKSVYYTTTVINTAPDDIETTYTIYSNTKCIKSFLEKLVLKYDNINRNKNKILYHFTYTGLKNESLTFQSRILSEENTENELFETFDKLHNEHVDSIKKDIDKLNDREYYKKHGLKRKKGYLFHGVPGSGKTSMVVAMALYDSRHIIEIPFSIITKHDEFSKLMDIKSINEIPINNNNIIMLFDEIDFGMDKINNQIISSNDNNIDYGLQVVNNISKLFDDNTTENKLNLGTMLSKLDGVGNYNGLIIVATTNSIHKINPSLYRELRLTPIEFKKLRPTDIIHIINNFFNLPIDNYSLHTIQNINITPAQLISLCQKYDHLPTNQFINDILSKI